MERERRDSKPRLSTHRDSGVVVSFPSLRRTPQDRSVSSRWYSASCTEGFHPKRTNNSRAVSWAFSRGSATSSSRGRMTACRRLSDDENRVDYGELDDILAGERLRPIYDVPVALRADLVRDLAHFQAISRSWLYLSSSDGVSGSWTDVVRVRPARSA